MRSAIPKSNTSAFERTPLLRPPPREMVGYAGTSSPRAAAESPAGRAGEAARRTAPGADQEAWDPLATRIRRRPQGRDSRLQVSLDVTKNHAAKRRSRRLKRSLMAAAGPTSSVARP